MQRQRSPIFLATLAVALLLFVSPAAVAQQPAALSADVAVATQDDLTVVSGPGAISTAFTYQGQLKSAGGAVNGACDFQFTLWDQSGTGAPPTGGSQLGSIDQQLAVAITNGLFTATVNGLGQFGDLAFQAARWLQIKVRCPAGSGSFVTLSPRQSLLAAPYAQGLRPGTRVRGAVYQILKVQSDAPTGEVPAAVTGEMISALDGVGVYGANNSVAANSAGAGVWGRTWNQNGAGVKGTAFNGSAGVLGESSQEGPGVLGVAHDTGIGVKAVSDGIGVGAPALFAEATITKTTEPAGIAVYALNHGGDATIVTRNTGTGDAMRVLNAAGTGIIYRVTATGRVVTSAVQIYGGGDVAERFETSARAALEPGTLMVIDDEHPGKLRPSTIAYDTKVAGVVSGAGGVNPGVTLSQEGVMEGDAVVAIAGRVYVLADADAAPIKPGDLLTSSAIPGYAMKVLDRALAQGAIIGKAMTGLEAGQGLVLVLVSLQ